MFENFRDSLMSSFGLDPAHYITLPSFVWDAMLKHTKVELELLTDIDMLHFFQSSIRGGLSTAVKRYAKANNKYMGEKYNPSIPDSYLMYYDINNLYGAIMISKLPECGFKWVNYDPDMLKKSIDSDIGYFFECDLRVPPNLHDFFNDLPLAPSKATPPGSNHPKLLATLYDKKNCILHERNLKQCLDLGVELVRVHRVIEFEQSCCLRPFVELNTLLRQYAAN